jgi:hypothetical protein
MPQGGVPVAGFRKRPQGRFNDTERSAGDRRAQLPMLNEMIAAAVEELAGER